MVDEIGLPAALSTLPCSPGHSIFTSVPTRKVLTGPNSLAIEKTAITMMYGTSAIMIRPVVSSRLEAAGVATAEPPDVPPVRPGPLAVSDRPPARPAGVTPPPPGTSSASAVAARRSLSASSVPDGCHTRRNAIVAPTATSEAMMSVSSTEMKLELTNWASAKLTPQTSAAGQVWRRPRRPSTKATRISGTNSARTGVCRPTTAPISEAGMLVSAAAVRMGVAIAPNATGAVLASRTIAAARKAEKPIAMSITPVIATGAPKPASASSRPPKQNAISTAMMRGSAEMRLNDARRSSKRPLTTVS